MKRSPLFFLINVFKTEVATRAQPTALYTVNKKHRIQLMCAQNIIINQLLYKLSYFYCHCITIAVIVRIALSLLSKIFKYCIYCESCLISTVKDITIA